MPYYCEKEDIDRLVKTHVCGECGRRLYGYVDLRDRRTFVACSDQHDSIAKEYQPSRWAEAGLNSLTIAERSKRMVDEHGQQVGTALLRAGVPLSGRLTEAQAKTVIMTIWEGAPEIEVYKASKLCADFGLHPLMKHIHLISFNVKQKDGSYKAVWNIILGIGATRQMMAQRGTFSYRDDTPRIMTTKEQMRVFGVVDNDNVVAITKLQTKDGLEAQGYGKYPLSETPKGMEKGNTRENMAFIRSERNAFGRLFPDSAFKDYEVMDEAYMDTPSGLVDKATGEVVKSPEPDEPPIEGEFTEVKVSPEEAKKLAEELWPDSLPTEKPELDFDPLWLMDSLNQVKFIKEGDDTTIKSYLKNVYKVDTQGTVIEVVARLSRDDRDKFFKEIQDRLDKV